MFGQMTMSPLMELQANCQLESAIAALLEAADQPAIVRWIEFPKSVLLFAIVSGNPQSGAIYWLDREDRTWYAIDFDDKEYGGYRVQQFEALLQNCGFLSLIESPGLLRSGLPWRLEMGKTPEAL